MSSRCRSAVLAVVLAASVAAACGGGTTGEAPPAARELRVCADPNNLPFTNEAGEGFENRLAEIVAADLGATVRYTWWAQRRGFVRNTVRAGSCDIVMGVPVDLDTLATTEPYYRSTYVFLSRADRGLALQSLDDPRLMELRIGVHVIGDDYANPPPAHALARRQIVQNVRGYSIFGDYRQPNPPARLIEAVAADDIDVAIVWGPFAGYFAARQPVPMELVPVPPEPDMPTLPFAFDIAVGVGYDDDTLRDDVNRILVHRAVEIRSLLDEYGIPSLPAPPAGGPFH